MVEDIGRTQGECPPLDLCIGPGDRPKNIRFSDVVVVQPVLRPGFIVIGGQGPVAVGNRDAILPLDIPLAMQRSEGKSLAGGKIEQRTGGGRPRRDAGTASRRQGRGLVVVAVEAAKHPVQVRDSQGTPQARVACMLRYGGVELRFTQPGNQSEPGSYLEFVVDEFRHYAAIHTDRRGRNIGRTVGKIIIEVAVLVLTKAVKAGLQVVLPEVLVEGDLGPRVVGVLIDGRDDRIIVWPAVVVGAIVVIKRRNRQERFWIESVDQGESHIAVGLALGVMQAARSDRPGFRSSWDSDLSESDNSPFAAK